MSDIASASIITWPVLAVVLTLVGMAVGGTVLVRRWISQSAGKAHERIDRLEDDNKTIRRDYVRRDDMHSFDQKIDGVATAVNRLADRFDGLQHSLIARSVDGAPK